MAAVATVQYSTNLATVYCIPVATVAKFVELATLQLAESLSLTAIYWTSQPVCPSGASSLAGVTAQPFAVRRAMSPPHSPYELLDNDAELCRVDAARLGGGRPDDADDEAARPLVASAPTGAGEVARAKEPPGAQTRGVIFALLASVGFSSMNLCVRLGTKLGMSVELHAVARGVVTAIVAMAFIRTAGVPTLSRGDVQVVIGRGMVGSCAMITKYFAVSLLPLSMATTIIFTSPAVSARLLPRERRCDALCWWTRSNAWPDAYSPVDCLCRATHSSGNPGGGARRSPLAYMGIFR